MKTRIVIVMVTLLVLLAGMLSLAGCGDTWHGFGRDVEDVGDDIQD